MNQILSVENVSKPKKEKKKKNKKQRNGISGSAIEAVKIIRFFAISLILFGCFTIGTGSYAIFKNKQEIASIPAKPTISVNQLENGKEVSINVNSEVAINEFYYKWNDEEEREIDVNGRTSIEQKIDLPSGDNMLTVRVVDALGQPESIQQSFSREASIVIQAEKSDPNIKIHVEGKNQIKEMSYRWNEEEAVKLEINEMTAEREIRALPGENVLTIEAVDVNGETEKLVKKINGVQISEPVVDVTSDGKANFVIDASDANGLTRVEFIINETIQKYKDLNNVKHFHDTYPFEEGENRLEVTVYNSEGQKAVFRALLVKPPENNNNEVTTN